MGKSRAQQFWIEPALEERYGGTVPIFRLVCKRHDRFSEIQFLSELLGASDHKYSKAGSRQLLLDRLTRQYSTCARNTGGNHIALIIDEAQYMHDAEYTTLCNLQNELDNLGYLLTVISVGSHELSYQYEAFLESGEMHLTGRFMVREAKFRGISCETELNFVLDGYDSLTEWPEGSGRSYTHYFLPQSFDAGFRMAKYSESLWSIFLALAPQIAGFNLEVPMEHVAKTVEAVFREFSDNRLLTTDLSHSELRDLIEKTGYVKHMNGIKLVIEYGSKG
jgi:hypothetical protein